MSWVPWLVLLTAASPNNANTPSPRTRTRARLLLSRGLRPRGVRVQRRGDGSGRYPRLAGGGTQGGRLGPRFLAARWEVRPARAAFRGGGARGHGREGEGEAARVEGCLGWRFPGYPGCFGGVLDDSCRDVGLCACFLLLRSFLTDWACFSISFLFRYACF